LIRNHVDRHAQWPTSQARDEFVDLVDLRDRTGAYHDNLDSGRVE